MSASRRPEHAHYQGIVKYIQLILQNLKHIAVNTYK